MVNNTEVQRNKGEECSFMVLGGAVVNKESIGSKLRVQSIVTFY